MSAPFFFGGGASNFYPYTVENSCRFNSADSAHLTRAQSAPTDQDVWTFHFWVKRAKLAVLMDFLSAGADGNNYERLALFSNDTIEYQVRLAGADAGDATDTGRVYRDPSAWCDVLISRNGSGASAIYIEIDGKALNLTSTSLSASVIWINGNTYVLNIGRFGPSPGAYGDYYLSSFAFVDGQALGSDSFVTVKEGVRCPINLSGITWGNNGFWLKFGNSAALGEDSSGNGNNFTVSGLAANDQVPDTPTNNYCTLNPLVVTASAANTYANGNLEVTTGTTGGGNPTATMPIPSTGKWYFEFTPSAMGPGILLGLWGPRSDVVFGYQHTPSIAYLSANGNKYLDNVITAYGATWTTSDVMGVAVDADAGTVTYYKNNVSQGSITYDASGLFPFFSDGSGASGAAGAFNFGQLGFTYTPPADHLALCTENLPEPTIGPNSDIKVSDVFGVVLYTGNGLAVGSGGKTVDCGVDMTSGDYAVLVKNRDAADSFMLFDTVRGATKFYSIDDGSNGTDTESLNAFTSTGVTFGNNAEVNTNGEKYVLIWIKVTAGFFDIQQFNGTGAATSFSHDLGVVPNFIFGGITDTAGPGFNPLVYCSSLPVADPETDYLDIATIGAVADSANIWNDTAPTSTTVSIGAGGGAWNVSGKQHTMYLIADVEGLCKTGYYKGDGNADGPLEHLGFLPLLHISKDTSVGSWYTFDSGRDTYNPIFHLLQLNEPNAESTASNKADLVATGVKMRTTDGDMNGNGLDFITLSIGASFKYSRAR